MAKLTPAVSFEGSDINSAGYGRIIKEGLPVVSFRIDKNRTGNYFFILPPYKLDRAGAGVWFRTVRVRTDFGTDPREQFAATDSDPVTFFANQVKLYYPDYAKFTEQQAPGSQEKRRVYPTFGRLTNKMIFNVAYTSETQLGPQLLVVPTWGVGDKIEAWARTRDPRGNPNPLLNNPDAAIPIYLKLDTSIRGQPWQVIINAGQVYKLPDELSDSEKLFNLDDVIFYPDPHVLYDKLRTFTPSDIFDHCMKGYRFPNEAEPVAVPESFGRTIKEDPKPAGAVPVMNAVPSGGPALAPPLPNIQRQPVPQQPQQPIAPPPPPGQPEPALGGRPLRTPEDIANYIRST